MAAWYTLGGATNKVSGAVSGVTNLVTGGGSHHPDEDQLAEFSEAFSVFDDLPEMAALRRNLLEERKQHAVELQKRDEEHRILKAELVKTKADAAMAVAKEVEARLGSEAVEELKRVKRELEALQRERAQEHGRHVEEMQVTSATQLHAI